MVAALTPRSVVARTRRVARESQSFRAFAVAFPALLIGYAFLDKGLAWVHVPGTPVFIGELVLAMGGLAVVTNTAPFLDGWRARPVLVPLLAFVAWGTLLTLAGFHDFGLSALQDSAVWYYSLAAFLVIGLLTADSQRLVRWTEGYGRILPYLLAWAPFALLFGKILSRVPGPLIPDSRVPFLEHKPGNVAVQASIALAFLWLVPRQSLTPRSRVILTSAAIMIALVAGTQNRGGLVAAALAGLLTVAMHRERARNVASTALVLLLVVLIAWATNVRFQSGNGRDVSVSQLTENVSSVLFGSDNTAVKQGGLGGTVEFREELWTLVVDKMRNDGRVLTGLGFGPNLAEEVGVARASSLDNPDLRSPHNSHLNILARTGAIGGVIWVSIWVVWFAALVAARARHWRAGRPFESGMCGVVMVGVAATLCNALFDPTLESAPAALWLWTMFGIGVWLIPRRFGSSIASR